MYRYVLESVTSHYKTLAKMNLILLTLSTCYRVKKNIRLCCAAIALLLHSSKSLHLIFTELCVTPIAKGGFEKEKSGSSSMNKLRRLKHNLFHRSMSFDNV